MNKLIKRILDISISLIAIIILCPIWLPVLLILRFTGDREIFYYQQRIGYLNQPFNIWKFVTMVKDSPDTHTGELTVRNDPRVTPIGKILRASKINELPQIFNIFKGDMSLVGPRPQTQKDFDVYTEEVKQYIYSMKPGITGIASIVFRDEEKILSETSLGVQECYDLVIAPYKGEIELWYIRNASFWTDVKIIFLTAWAIIFPESKLIFTFFKDLPKQDLKALALVEEQKKETKKTRRLPTHFSNMKFE